MSHNCLKLLTLCPYELIKILNTFISIKFKHNVYQQCIRLHVNPLLRRLCFYWCLSFRLPATLIKHSIHVTTVFHRIKFDSTYRAFGYHCSLRQYDVISRWRWRLPGTLTEFLRPSPPLLHWWFQLHSPSISP